MLREGETLEEAAAQTARRLDLQGLSIGEALERLEAFLEEGDEDERGLVLWASAEGPGGPGAFLQLGRRLMVARKARRVRRCYGLPRAAGSAPTRFLLVFGARPWLFDPDAPPSLSVDESASLGD